MNKEYLGDSVYAEIESGYIKLTTDNGYGPTNVIYLEPVVAAELERYIGQMRVLALTVRTRTAPNE